MFEVTPCHPLMPPMGTVWESVCEHVCVSEVTEAHSSVPPKSTTAHLDLTQTALFANKNTLSPELDLHFFFLLVIGFLLFLTPLPFVLTATFNLMNCLFVHIPSPSDKLWEGYLKLRGKFGELSSRVPRGMIDWHCNSLHSVCSALLIFPLPSGLFLIHPSLHLFIPNSLQMHTCCLQAKVSLEVIASVSWLPVFQHTEYRIQLGSTKTLFALFRWIFFHWKQYPIYCKCWLKQCCGKL